mmetsp:Transcript_2362/g.6825  ORF Transcript_2362/g.6825 Transcript_2362/m.6825 type:complete len:291 (+) Transcript_2362:490-1362(+)
MLAMNTAEPAAVRHETTGTEIALESVLGIQLADFPVCLAPLLRVALQPSEHTESISKRSATVLAGGVGGVLLACRHVLLKRHAPTTREHAKCSQKCFLTVLASEPIRRIHATPHRMSVPGVRVTKELPTKAFVGEVHRATLFVGISQNLAIRGNAAHHTVASNEELLTVHALEAVCGVGLAYMCMMISRVASGEHPPTEACVSRVPRTPSLMCVSQRSSIGAAKTEHVERGDIKGIAKLTLETIDGVQLAPLGVGVPRLAVEEELPAEARVRWVIRATSCMHIPLSSSVR